MTTTTNKSQKRRCIRRGHASTHTTMLVSNDAWLLVCMHLEYSPHTVFRLMMTCRSTLSAFQNASEAWWVEFFEKIKRYQGSLKHSNFLKRLELLHQHQHWDKKNINNNLNSCRDALLGLFAPRCHYCGTRFGHRLLRPFLIRTCADCLKANAISNNVLELRYGLSFSDFLEVYAKEGGFLLPLDSFRLKAKALTCLSNDELDACYYIHKGKKNTTNKQPATTTAATAATHTKSVKSNVLYFFWKPDIERILGLNLEQRLLIYMQERKQAVSVLSAYFQRHSESALTSQALRLFRCSDSFCLSHQREHQQNAKMIDIKAWRALAQSMRVYNNNIIDSHHYNSRILTTRGSSAQSLSQVNHRHCQQQQHAYKQSW